jgi:hypothetical protein
MNRDWRDVMHHTKRKEPFFVDLSVKTDRLVIKRVFTSIPIVVVMVADGGLELNCRSLPDRKTDKMMI